MSLLANVLLRQQGIDAGAAETILLRDGWLTDASSSTVYVISHGQVCAPPNSHRLLPGTTRSLVEELAGAHGIAYASVPLRAADLRAADEVWLSAATRGVIPVTRLDGAPVGTGVPGPLWQRMHGLIEAYWEGV